jgi:hypothetical protein
VSHLSCLENGDEAPKSCKGHEMRVKSDYRLRLRLTFVLSASMTAYPQRSLIDQTLGRCL